MMIISAATVQNVDVHCLMLLGRTLCGNIAACAVSPGTGAHVYTQLTFSVLKTWVPILKADVQETTTGALLQVHAPVYQDAQ